jgi:hypothetical protein
MTMRKYILAAAAGLISISVYAGDRHADCSFQLMDDQGKIVDEQKLSCLGDEKRSVGTTLGSYPVTMMSHKANVGRANETEVLLVHVYANVDRDPYKNSIALIKGGKMLEELNFDYGQVLINVDGKLETIRVKCSVTK